MFISISPPPSTAIIDASPQVVSNSDITFSMLADPAAAMAVAIGYPDTAAVNGITASKGYIDCSTVSVDCSQRIASEVSIV